MMLIWIYVLFVYEIFANLQSEFARRAMISPPYENSALERRLWKSNSPVSFFAMSFQLLARLNGVAFLIYLAVTTVWWHALGLWVGCLVSTSIAASMFRGHTGLAIPGLLAFIVLPIAGAWLWLTFLP